ADEERMITFFLSKKEEAAADGATFKTVVCNALVAEMALHHTTGAMKTVSAYKSKFLDLVTNLNSLQLRAAYNLIMTLKGLSGLGDHWDDEKGMNVGLQEADAWNTYCTKHDKAKAYTHKGFPLYQLMSGPMPSMGKGTHAFHPS
ncbi:hypothetical protein L208DRAFT_1174287, partial [Tricholoma matsutake]